MHGPEKCIVYILCSEADPSRHYVGITNDVQARLKWHNAGPSGYTVDYRPWSVAVVIEFPSEREAVRFERYLKSGSGRAFAKRHFAPHDRSVSSTEPLDRKKGRQRVAAKLRNLRTQHRVRANSFGNLHDVTLARIVTVVRLEDRTMTDGLKLTLSGSELRTLLEERIADHQRHAERWTHESARTAEDETEDAPLLPDHICTNEAERHAWRAEVLQFIRDHVETAETYRLSASDLKFGELLPPKPGWLEQEEYEERTGVRFMLERVTKAVDTLAASAHRQWSSEEARQTPGIIAETDEFRTTRVDTGDGPEVMMIDRK